MAIKYVDSAASGANDGSSWTDAWTSLASAYSVAAGTDVYIEYRHSESPSSDQTVLFTNSTRNSKVRLLSVDKDNSNALRAGAIFGTSNATYYIVWIQKFLYVYGVTFRSSWDIRVGRYDISNDIRLENCVLNTDRLTNGPGYLYLMSYTDYGSAFISLFDCTYTPGGVHREIRVMGSSNIHINNFTSGGTPGTNAAFDLQVANYNAPGKFLLENSDLSAHTTKILNGGNGTDIVVRRCKIASGVTFVNSKSSQFQRATLEQCDDGTITVPPLSLNRYEGAYGYVQSTLSVYRTGGADDGVQANAYAWECVTNSNALEIFNPLDCPSIVRWVAPDGSISGATAKGIFTTTRCAIGATPTALTTDGTSTWNGSGVGTKQKIDHTLSNGQTLTVYVASGGTLNDDDFWIEVSEPDQVGGPVTVQCFLAKPSTTVYVDPRLEVA